MALGSWWRGDSLPDLPTLQGFSARIATDIQLIERLTRLSQQEIEVRLQHGHHAYIAYIAETPVAYGWVEVVLVF